MFVCCEGDGNADVGSGGGVVAMSLASAGDVLEMSEV